MIGKRVGGSERGALNLKLSALENSDPQARVTAVEEMRTIKRAEPPALFLFRNKLQSNFPMSRK